MKSLKDHIGTNWVKWILFIVFTVVIGINSYVINRVDAIQLGNKDYVRKEDYVREVDEVKRGIRSLNDKMDALLIHNSIKIPSQAVTKE